MDKKSKRYMVEMADIPLIEYNNIFVGNLVWLSRGIENDIATYDLVVREIPRDWGFYMMFGVERMVSIIENYGFDEEALDIMRKMGLVTPGKAEKFYKNFKFSGDIRALKDGTIFFPGEPIVRVTAPILEANLLTALFLNVFSYPIRIMTKLVRYKISTEGTIFLSGGVVRLPGFEQGIFATEASIILGSNPVAPIFFKKFPEYPVEPKISFNVNHALIKSFDTERDAFRYMLDRLIKQAKLITVMVDTYDCKKGIQILIEEMKKTPGLDSSIIVVTIDSGDLHELCVYARKEFDDHGFKKIKLQVISNLDEYKIEELRRKGTPADIFFSATETTNISDNPRLEVVYKLAELRKPDGSIEYKAKLAEGKKSYPGRKQVFRVYDDKGNMTKDIIGLEDEKLGTPLLESLIEKGSLATKLSTIEEMREYIKKELSLLPDGYKKIKNPDQYKVEVSEKLNTLLEGVKNKVSNS